MDMVFQNSYMSTYREVTQNGKEWLVVSGIPLVEGVLNGRLVTASEFGAFASDWNGVPIVVNHPKLNGGSARVPAPDVTVAGMFYNAGIDKANRLVGEFWLDKIALSRDPQGKAILDSVKSNHTVEVSTGYYSASYPEPGTWNGQQYTLVDKQIRPDHIALLPNQEGACSIKDGCGLNRNMKANEGNSNSGNHGHGGRKGEIGGSTSDAPSSFGADREKAAQKLVSASDALRKGEASSLVKTRDAAWMAQETKDPFYTKGKYVSSQAVGTLDDLVIAAINAGLEVTASRTKGDSNEIVYDMFGSEDEEEVETNAKSCNCLNCSERYSCEHSQIQSNAEDTKDLPVEVDPVQDGLKQLFEFMSKEN